MTYRNGQYFARMMQNDGNFVLYNDRGFSSNNAVWDSKTSGKGQGPFRLIMQEDGHLVIYDRNNQPTWGNGTYNKGIQDGCLIMQDDRILVLYDKYGKPHWATNTNIRLNKK